MTEMAKAFIKRTTRMLPERRYKRVKSSSTENAASKTSTHNSAPSKRVVAKAEESNVGNSDDHPSHVGSLGSPKRHVRLPQQSSDILVEEAMGVESASKLVKEEDFGSEVSSSKKRPFKTRRLRKQPKPLIIPECSSCGERLTAELTPSRTPTKTCKHDTHVCITCTRYWISSQLEISTWNKLACPECPAPLEHDDVQVFADPQTFERYDTLATRAALSADANFRWCISPNCQSGQLHTEGAAAPIFTCNACNHKACVICDSNWHQDETCEQFISRIASNKNTERQSEEALMTISKPCPGPDCSYRIQKNGGCDHMTCSRCGHQFCWLCLAAHTDIRRHGNHRHAETCKHYA